jgi:hypothetical protein
MRNERLLLPLLPISLLLGAFGLVSAACGGSSSSGSSGSPTSDCVEDANYGTTPAVNFKTDVLPIFQGSCGLSTACHGCDGVGTPGCTTPGYQPFLGVSLADPPMTTGQIAAIISSAVGQPAILQPSAIDGSMVGNSDMSIIKASDPANSFMMYKLSGSFPTTPDSTEVTCSTLTCAAAQSCGGAMPSGGPALAASDIATIGRWIAPGATTD